MVKKDDDLDEVLGYTILPIEEISNMIDGSKPVGGSTQVDGKFQKTLLLYRSSQSRKNFSFQNDLTVGKLVLALEYERDHPVVDKEDLELSYSDQEAEQDDVHERRGRTRARRNEVKETVYERETSVQKLIPKRGFFIFRVLSISDLKRGLGYVLEKNEEVQELLGNKYGGGARLAVYFDLFWEDKDLRDVVAPFEIELSSKQIDFEEIIVDKSTSKYAEMSSDIIEYIQHKSAKVEVRLHMNDKKQAEDEEHENDVSKRTGAKHVTICGCKLPLLSLITSQKGVQGDFSLTNSLKSYCGVIGLHMTFNKENKAGTLSRTSTMRNREKDFYVVMLSFNELVSVIGEDERERMAEERQDAENIFSLEFEVEGETKKSTYYSLNRWKEKVPLDDCFFVFTVDGQSDFLRKPLEIKLLEKKKPKYMDKVYGFGSLDLFEAFKEHMNENKTLIESFYCPLTDVEKAKTLKTRLGMKVGIVRTRNQLEAKKLMNYLNKVLSGELSKDSANFRTQDLKKTGTLSKTKLQETLKQVNILFVCCS